MLPSSPKSRPACEARAALRPALISIDVNNGRGKAKANHKTPEQRETIICLQKKRNNNKHILHVCRIMQVNFLDYAYSTSVAFKTLPDASWGIKIKLGKPPTSCEHIRIWNFLKFVASGKIRLAVCVVCNYDIARKSRQLTWLFLGSILRCRAYEEKLRSSGEGQRKTEARLASAACFYIRRLLLRTVFIFTLSLCFLVNKCWVRRG